MVMVRRRKKKVSESTQTAMSGNGVKISYDMPIPETTGRGRPAKWPWGSIKVGGSFLMTDATCDRAKSNVASANRRHKPKHFIYRLDDDGCVRVWRDR